jgi:iron complex transport system ATP-binding protein
MENYLSLKNISCGYSNFNLKNINFSLNKGSLTGIIGPNGSGKTTLFKGITGELSIKSGAIALNNKNLKSMPLREKACNLAIVTQFAETLDISVEDYVLMGRMPYRNKFQFFETKEDIEIAEKYMKLTDILNLKDKPMSQLSGGEQQLADIARALTQEPKLLLLDEPTSHLDITHQMQILNLIQTLNSKLELTVLMIIHDLSLAGEFCDYLIMMNNGKIHKKGIAEKVLSYKNIEDVYKTVVITQINPLSKKPSIFPISDKTIKNNSSLKS